MMKRLCVAGLVVAGAPVMAQSSVAISGTLDVGLRHVRNGSLGSDDSEVSGANATSKLIIRGTEDLGGGLSAGFYLDGSLLADMGTAGATAPAGQFWDRRATVSLGHSRWGELRPLVLRVPGAWRGVRNSAGSARRQSHAARQ